MEVWGYRRHPGKLVLCLAGVLCTGGLLGLIFYWLRHWWVVCSHSLTSLELASSVLIVVRQEYQMITSNSKQSTGLLACSSLVLYSIRILYAPLCH